MSVEQCTTDKLSKIYLGDTGPVLQPRPTVLDDGVPLDANWTCHIAANYADGTVAIASTEVTDKTADNLRWIAALTPTQTATLTIPVGEAFIVIDHVLEIVNLTLTPVFRKEVHHRLPVCAQGIA